MAIITFWSGLRRSNGQTLSTVATATQMAVEHNLRCLLINGSFDDDSMERCFWSAKQKAAASSFLETKGKLDIGSGAEGLVSAVASNKTTPEIISNFTKVVFKDRLDVLPGLKTKIFADFEKSMMLYKDLINAANKYYDVVFVDLPKGLDRDFIKAILDMSSLIVYTLPQNLAIIDNYMEDVKKYDVLKKGNLMPLVTNAFEASKYNAFNIRKYIGYKQAIGFIPVNVAFMEAASEAGVSNLFIKARLSTNKTDPNVLFVKSVDDFCKKLIQKLQDLKYTV
ncbi:MAG: hypothetical protein IKN74_02580 [Clostridia bacterium]|nr:hypothetical protein [Clostridia bacterium]